MKIFTPAAAVLLTLSSLCVVTHGAPLAPAASPQMQAFKPKTHPLSALATPAWIQAEAKKLNADPMIFTDAVRNNCRQHIASLGLGLSPADVETLTIAVMQQATANADADLRAVLAQVKQDNERKAALRKPMGQVHADKVSASADSSGVLQMKLQQAMDRRSKFSEALSNLLKKQSETSDAIVQNMK
jgi:hypothetical protein